MATQIDVINRALIELGKDPITSIDDNSDAARVMRALWATVLDSTLSLSNWGFAGAVAQLATNGEDTLDFRYANKYPLPGEFVKLRRILPEDCSYRLTGDAIFTDAGAPLVISYTQRVVAINRWPALVTEVFSARLAVAAALKLTGSRSMRKSMVDWMETQLSEARHVHSHEHSQETFLMDQWLEARRQGS